MTNRTDQRGETHVVEGEPAMRALGRRLGESIRLGATIAIEGELGAGKTRLVAGLAEGLGLDPGAVSSPTFTLVHEHRGGRDGATLAHMDAWRLHGEDDLESVGFDELVADDATVVAIEWASRIADRLPAAHVAVTIEIDGDTTRRVRVHDPAGLLAARATDGPAERCRTCGAACPPEHAPFCSDRCRLADLHGWLAGNYRIARPIEEDDLMDGG